MSGIKLLIIIAILISSLEPSLALTDEKKRTGSKEVAVTSEEKLPYRVLVGDNVSPDVVVTLATGAVTTLICPEPPVNFLSGHNEELGKRESDDRASNHALYLRPSRAGIFTNVIVEMKSGTASFFVRTIDVPGGAKPGDFHREVVVRPTNYSDQIKELTERSAQLELSLSKAAEKEKELKKLVEDTKRKTDELVRVAEEKKTKESLTILERYMYPIQKPKPVESKMVRIRQVGIVWKDGENIATYELTNRSAKESIVVEYVSHDGGLNVVISTSQKEIQPNNTVRVAVRVDGTERRTIILNWAVAGNVLKVPMY
jgi:hypothetical protein